MNLRNFEIKSEMKKKSLTKFKNKLSCILLLYSHLILSLKAYSFYSFPSQYIYSARLYAELYGKSLVLPRYYK
jgi:hypothetical protein